ncbi:F-box protein At3g07870-like [Telopea speciosissima]|uniref:F-box protein At3g07870-like n=1 Tax=Telopea speciosissima TaxID=54955 RepID=UPI001CC75657|nr:F-box protein At3g07870-like [Telopea speciosissima]
MTPTAPYLAREIIIKILLWLPLASFYNASLVCKEWHSIIWDPNFLRAYYLDDLGFTLLLQEPTLRLYETYLDDLGSLFSKIASAPVQETRLRQYKTYLVTMTARVRITGRIVSSCNQLALIKPKVEKPNLFVINFATQEILELPQRPLSLIDEEYLNYYALGFNPTTKEYKVVCFGRTYENNDIKCGVLTQGSTTWRPINETLDGFIVPGKSVSINGFLHWHGDVFTRYSTKIISMDLDTEKILETPVPIIYIPQHPCAFDLLEIDGRLSLIEYEVSCQIQFKIWSLEDISENTWERIFNVSLESIRCEPVQSLDDLYHIGSLYNGKFLLFKQQKKWVNKLDYFVVDVVKQEMKPVAIDIRMLSGWNACSLDMSSGSPF